MKRYLVKQISVATKENPNFAGKISTSFHGKDGEFEIGDTHSGHLVREYGYKRRGDAKRNWTYKNPENSKYWKSTVEIVEVEISV